MLTKYLNATLLIAYCGLIYYLSSQPALPAPMLFLHQDKIVHFGFYFILGLIAWRFFGDYIQPRAVLLVVSLSYCSSYGLLDEWHQSFVPGRSADVADWAFDTLGAAVALFWMAKKNSWMPSV